MAEGDQTMKKELREKELVDVLMIFHNEERHLPRLIKCLERQQYIHKIYAINDFSTDSSREICKDAGLEIIDVDVPWKQRTLKLAYNLNLGLKYVTAKYVLKLDSDMFLPNDYVKRLVESFEKHEKKEPYLYSISGKSINNENRWIKMYSTLFAFYGYGQARLYKRNYLTLIKGFHDDASKNISEDVLTDLIARNYGFYTMVDRKAVCYHLRPYKDNCAINPEVLFFDMFVCLLLRERDRLKQILRVIKGMLQQKGGFKAFLKICGKNTFLLFLSIAGEKWWMRVRPTLKKLKRLIRLS